MPSIHLIEKTDRYHCVDEQANEWESGFWVISIKQATRFIHGNIYLHRGQKEPSFTGGEITGFRVVQYENREKVVFRFKRQASYQGVKTSPDGWRNEQKRVWD